MHAEGCGWEGFYFSLYCPNDNGKDEQVSIDEDGILFDSNTTNPEDTKDDFVCVFKYCPYCGCEL